MVLWCRDCRTDRRHGSASESDTPFVLHRDYVCLFTPDVSGLGHVQRRPKETYSGLAPLVSSSPVRSTFQPVLFVGRANPVSGGENRIDYPSVGAAGK